MRRRTLIFCAGLGLWSILLPAPWARADQVKLNFYGDVLFNATMDLKDEIRFQWPGISFDRYQIDRVDIRAGGNGHAKLYINNQEVDSVGIFSPFKIKDFALRNETTSPGSWILGVSGTAKIYGATVHYSPVEFSERDGWELQPYCSCRTNKRCYVRTKPDGNTEYGPCQFDCPGGCRDE